MGKFFSPILSNLCTKFSNMISSRPGREADNPPPLVPITNDKEHLDDELDHEEEDGENALCHGMNMVREARNILSDVVKITNPLWQANQIPSSLSMSSSSQRSFSGNPLTPFKGNTGSGPSFPAMIRGAESMEKSRTTFLLQRLSTFTIIFCSALMIKLIFLLGQLQTMIRLKQ